jgi:hypothetical protein
MGSLPDDYKCPLCGRVGNGGYDLDGFYIGPICTGATVHYSCLDRTCQEDKPLQIITKSLEMVLGRLHKRYPTVALQLAPYVRDVREQSYEEFLSSLPPGDPTLEWLRSQGDPTLARLDAQAAWEMH